MHYEENLGEQPTERSAISHLEHALDVSEDEQTNYHIRQAMQLLIADER